VTYSNDGTAAIAAPYVRLEAGNNAYVRFSETDAWSKSVEFLATSDKSPASSLNAGETVEIPVFVYTTTQQAQISISYTQSSAEAFPWSDIGASLKPSYVDDAAWAFALATLKSRFGTTWNSYLSRLRANADYLAENGRPVRRLDRLLQIEINRALGVDAVLPVLASVTDAARSARGVGLSFTRSYSSAMYGRFTSGILGYGWTDNLSTSAELSSDGKTLVFRIPGGGSYSFTKATGSWKPEDSRDKTVLTESSSAYTLTYQSGTVQTFAKSNMRTSSIADNCGNVLTFTWNGKKLQKISHTDGQSLTFAYSGGLLSSVTDDCGRQTVYTYSNSLLTKVTASDGLETLYEYRAADGTAAARALSRIVYPDGTTREFAYDTSSGLVSAVSSNGGMETTTISRDGGVVTLTGPDGAETIVTTGVSGETLETTDALGGTSTKGYTEDGLLRSVVSPSGLNGKIEHDALGRVSKSVSAAGKATAFAYEGTFGNLKTVTDAKSHAVTYGYDAKGRGTSVTFADGSASKLEYNSRGDVVKSTNRRGQTVTYAYDSKGRVTKKTWSSGRTFTYAYDVHGNVTTATDSETGTVTMQYDSADRLTKITYPKGRGFTFTYDSCGRLAVRTSLDGAVERFVYDASGRLASVSDGNGATYLQNTYDETTGRLTRQVNGNGTSVSYLYDKLGRVVSIEHSDAEGKIVESLQYCYDADGRCIRASSLLGEERYEYDKDGQLISVRYPDSPSEAFAYDAVGNRTIANGATYIVNNLNQYTAILGGSQSSATAIIYDKDGNMTSLTDANGTTSYSYDTLNRLVAVSNPAAGINWSCRYDVLGNRVSVTDNGVTTERTYLQGSLPSVAAEYVNGQLKERHIVVGAVRIADITGTTGVSPVDSESTRYYHADLIGSTRLVTDGNGAIIDRRAYKAFGETRTTGGSQPLATTTAGYVGTLGVETDPTGLLFMRNRYYSPTLGRFIQMDPIGLNGGDMNQYRYCMNDSSICIDPNGLWYLSGSVSAGAGLIATLGGAIGTDENGDFIISLTGGGGGGIGLNATGSIAWDGHLKEDVTTKWVSSASFFRGATISFDAKNQEWDTSTVRRLTTFGLGASTTMEGDISLNVSKLYRNVVEGIKNLFNPPPQHQQNIGITPNGSSGGTYKDKFDDIELVDGSPTDMTVSGSFTISFEWVVRINPKLDYPNTFGRAAFYVDGIAYGLGGIVDDDGVLVRYENINVTGEGSHSLRWNVELLTSLPVSYGVRNVKIVRSTQKYTAAAKSAATVVPQYSVQKAGAQSVKALSEVPGAALVRNRTSAQSTKAASPRLLASPGNNTPSPRLYCYERYVAVKGLAYRFALSADEDASISVSGLPSGFSFFDGVISGTASAAGTTTMTITANGSSGTTTKSVQFTVIEATEDFQSIISLMSHPDLRPSMASGWSAPLVVSTSANSTYGATAFLDTDSLYVSWIIDCGNVNAEGTFYTCLYVDDVLQAYWHTEGLQRDYYTGVKGYSLGALSVGTHKVRIVTDATGVVAESDESNNSFETTITVVRDWFPDLSVSSLSVSRTSIAVSESATVHWRVENNGDAEAKKTQTAFEIWKYDSSVDGWVLKKTEWLACNPLAAGAGRECSRVFAGKTLGVGIYRICVWADGKDAEYEKNEIDNYAITYITVSKDNATSSKSSVDWQFRKLKSSEADSFFLSASSSLKKKATTFKVGQKIYMRRAYWNATKKAVSGQVVSAYWLNGEKYSVPPSSSSIGAKTILYNIDTLPSFLQNLPAGKYTLTAVLDSENNFVETNEKNNIRTISFTVVGAPAIYGEETYTCALNESVNWPVSSEGSMTVKGLPKGMKYSGGSIVGKATKLGTFSAKFTSKNAAGTRTKTVKIVVINPGFDVSVNVRANGATDAVSVAPGETIPMFVGVVQNISVASTPGKDGIAKSGASSVTAAGLPPGLKYSKGVISGVPSKVGTYTVKLTFKNALGWTKTFTMKMQVKALPAFARGTFNGWSYDADYYYKRKVTVSVTTAGKITAKVGTLSFARTGWTVDEAGRYCANLLTTRTVGTGKKAKKYTDVLTLTLDPDAPWTEDQLSGKVATFNGTVKLADALVALNGGESALVPSNADLYVSARRNPFGDNADAKALAAELVALGTQTLTDDDGLVWNLKVASNGVATIARTTGAGKNKKTVSATAVVAWDGDEYGPYAVFLVDGKIMGVSW
jgi:RHS repeat-associated protein